IFPVYVSSFVTTSKKLKCLGFPLLRHRLWRKTLTLEPMKFLKLRKIATQSAFSIIFLYSQTIPQNILQNQVCSFCRLVQTQVCAKPFHRTQCKENFFRSPYWKTKANFENRALSVSYYFALECTPQ